MNISQKKIASNSIIISNPPFENVEILAKERVAGDLRYARSGQAGELLRRIVNHASPNTLFGIVVPQTLLDGASFRELRRNLLSNVEIREVVTFPDNVFKFAKPETAILIGKKLGDNQARIGKFKFRRIQKTDMDAFRNENRVPNGAWFLQSDALAHPQHQLLLPPLAEVWAATERLPRLNEMAHVTIGFYFFAETDGDYPKGEIQVSAEKLPDFYQGFLLAEGTPDTHLLPRLEWLNQKLKIIRRECGGTKRGEPRVVMNHVRTGGGAWRHKAFIDSVGRPATDAFLLLSPVKANWSLEILWAFANGPFANAFTLTNSATKQIGVRLLQKMRVPALSEPPLDLKLAVQTYIAAAGEFTVKYGSEDVTSKKREKSKKTKEAGETPDLPLVGLSSERPDEESIAREHLRDLHWRVDAEVLKLYGLPAELERELLDFFDGVPRVGVPFEQTEYFPKGFTDLNRLSELLAITADWPKTNRRRAKLIDLEEAGRLNPEQATELEQLQQLADARVNLLKPRQADAIDHQIENLKRQGLWVE
ncbi:MAG: N-6 DNA methylase [Limisphaerales bacterium]